MRSLFLIFLCAGFCFLPAAGVKSFNPEFTKDGEYPENAPAAVLITSVEDLRAFSESEMYKQFDKKFFKKNNLVVALLERGSGSISFKLTDVSQCGDTLTVEVKRHSPIIQTLDYRTHVLTLPICRADFPATNVNVIIK